jgi:hypothetical protein
VHTFIGAQDKFPGDGNDSFHQFTHRLGLGEQPHFDWLGALLKNPDGHHFFGNRFFWLFRGQESHPKWREEVPVCGHDKELFFRKWGEISGLGVYPSLCELVEGIVTVPHKRSVM